VVPVVLVRPPLVTDADDGVGQEASGTVIRRAGFEDLAVGRLVGKERQLGQQNPQDAGDQQLEPAVPEQHKARRGTGNTEGKGGKEGDVEGTTPAQQPGVPNRAQQVGVTAGGGSATGLQRGTG